MKKENVQVVKKPKDKKNLKPVTATVGGGTSETLSRIDGSYYGKVGCYRKFPTMKD